eukprot:gene23244-28132_t
MSNPVTIAPSPSYGGVETPPLKYVLVTGANAGLGFETCAQLAKIPGIAKVILGCRTKAKAEDALQKLVQQTGVPATVFDVLAVDTSSNKSCRDAVAELAWPIQGLVCNAGGIGTTPQAETDSGALCLFAQNIVGHAVLIETLMDQGKLAPGGRVILSVSEQARGIPELGMKPPPILPTTADHLAGLINGTEIKDWNNEAYGSAKAIGALYIGCLARKYSGYYFLSVSPGGTSGTSIFSFLGPCGSCLMCCLKATGQMHDVGTGAQRYIAPLCSKTYPSGQFIASAKGQTGAVANQATLWDVFSTEDAQDSAYEALHRYMN